MTLQTNQKINCCVSNNFPRSTRLSCTELGFELQLAFSKRKTIIMWSEFALIVACSKMRQSAYSKGNTPQQRQPVPLHVCHMTFKAASSSSAFKIMNSNCVNVARAACITFWCYIAGSDTSRQPKNSLFPATSKWIPKLSQSYCFFIWCYNYYISIMMQHCWS